MTLTPLILIAPFLTTAALLDLRSRRIPNALTVALALTGLAWSLVGAHGSAVLSGIAAALAVVTLLWVPWTRGSIGGGDVKLAAATALWLGISLLPTFLIVSMLAGGVVSLFTLLSLARPDRNEARAGLMVLLLGRTLPILPVRGRKSVPYAVAIALGALITLGTK